MNNAKKNPTLNIWLLLAALIALIVLSALSCSTTKNDSSTSSKISSLENKIALLEARKNDLESKYNAEIKELESVINDLRAQIDTKAPSETDNPDKQENEYFGFKYYTEDGKTTIISYSGSSSDLIIPASIAGSPVVAIADNAFQNSSLVSVLIPETIESIGWFAFDSCSMLQRVVLSKNITEIGYSAFANCNSLVIYAPQSSYAYQYAKSYGIQVSAE